MRQIGVTISTKITASIDEGGGVPNPADGLSPLSRGMRLGPEDRVCLEFASALRVAALEGRLGAVFCHVPNELARRGPAAALARALGLITGTSDYLFLWEGGSAALEAKAPGSYPSPIQRDFRDWCGARGVPWFVFRSAGEGLSILRDLGVLP